MTVVVLLGAIGAGYLEQRHYLERRYENTSPQLKLAEALRWGRDLRDSKVAVSGIRGVFNQYPFYGTDLSNEVQWLGVEGPDEAWLRIPTCAEWREEVNEGGYDYVVTTYDPFLPGKLTDTKEALWTREDPSSKEILRDGPVSVFDINGEMDPAACGDLPDLEPAELSGDSVNAEPLANQPTTRRGHDQRLIPILGTALLFLILSLIWGRALLHLLGQRRPTWVSGAVGFAALIVVAPLLIRLPGRATTAAVVIGIATLDRRGRAAARLRP